MFSNQCNRCGERWEMGRPSTCKCEVIWDASAPLVPNPNPSVKQWIGLTLVDLPDNEFGNMDFVRGARWAEEKLREKNQ
jgi:hypothetical protein